MLLLGGALVERRSAMRRLGFATLACGTVGLAGLVLLGARITFALGIGALERVADYPFPFWLGVTGVRLLRLAAPPARLRSPVERGY